MTIIYKFLFICLFSHVNSQTNLCEPSPCGDDAKCHVTNNRPVCSCPIGFTGNPFTRCIRDVCAEGVCGINANCVTKQGNPVCSCRSGYEGDPFVECTTTDLCRPSPCGVNTKCKVINERPVCECLRSFEGNPLNGCIETDVLKIVEPSEPVEPVRPIYIKKPFDGYGSTSTVRQSNGNHHPQTARPTTDECLPSVTQVNRGQVWVCSGELIFEENFDNFDTAKWTQDIRFADKPDYEFVAYIKDKAILNLSQGILKIKPQLITIKYNDDNFVNEELDFQTTCTGIRNTHECYRKAYRYNILPPILSGRMNTKRKFSFKYGKVEIRAKLPKGNWIYPELYLSPEENTYGPDYDSGQIWIAYMPGNAVNRKQFSGGLILGSSPEARSSYMRSHESNQPWSDDFHVYEITWSPNVITLSVDGHEYGEITPPDGGFSTLGSTLKVSNAANLWELGGKMAPFDQEFYLDIGLGVGGVNFPDSPKKPWKHSDPKAMLEFWRQKSKWYTTWGDDSVLEVDYIKVYAL